MLCCADSRAKNMAMHSLGAKFFMFQLGMIDDESEKNACAAKTLHNPKRILFVINHSDLAMKRIKWHRGRSTPAGENSCENARKMRCMQEINCPSHHNITRSNSRFKIKKRPTAKSQRKKKEQPKASNADIVRNDVLK